jgi:Mlc titration factor MtfA (ptsG expression regulator)
MLFSWLKRRRRRKILAAPFPPEWLGYLQANVPIFERLSEREKATLRDDLRIFVAEKHWEGCGGLTITDEIKVTIAAHACLLLLGIDHDSFESVLSILVYPSGFRSPDGWAGPDGVVHADTGLLGEAWRHGPVILAWDNVLAGGRNILDGRNVVLHEFAHQLDYLDGVADGTPPLHNREQYRKWHDVMTAEYAQLVAESEHGKPKVLDAYGATNPAEFFAVATECFFEKAVQMKHRHPQLYAVLQEYYCQDPARRFAPEPAAEEPKTVGIDVEPLRKRRWWQKSPRHRGSRAVQKLKAFEEEARSWPGWVRIWGFHPGQRRAHAHQYLDRHLTTLLLLLLLLSVGFLRWNRFHPGHLPLLVLFAGLSVSAIWLYCVIRWIDRHGRWAGQARTGHARSSTPP